jgi:hypothetical protein
VGIIDWLFLGGTIVFFGYMMLVYRIMDPITRMDQHEAAEFPRKTKPWRTVGAGIGCVYLVLLGVALVAMLLRWTAGDLK